MSTKKNPYAASLAAEAPARPPPKASEKPRDTVLSRVQKRAQVSKPPVKFSMTPRYRFALPDPPTDLKMLRGALAPSAAPALRASKLELDAKKTVVPSHPSYGLRADLVVPAQYAHRGPGMELLPEDQVVLAAIQPRAVGGAVARKEVGGRRAMPPPKRAKGATAFPWMRRMSYDEYASESGRERKAAGAGVGGASAAAAQAKRLQQQLRNDRKRTFELAGVPAGQIRHPDKAKRELRAVKSVPVFPDMEDWSTDLISMQFDMMSPLHNVQRFAGKRERGMKAFESAVSISVSDDANKMFLSCFAPDDQMLEELEGAGEDVPRIGDEYHELLREYVIREAGAGAHQQDSKEEESRPRATRTFVVTTEGEGNSEVVGLSGIPTAWLMAPRPSTWTPLAHPALELRREPLSRDIKRRRRERIVEELSPGG